MKSVYVKRHSRRIYHGTCSVLVSSIRHEGLRSPAFITDSKRLARIFADGRCDDLDKGGESVILEIDLTDEERARLEPDFAMVRHPMYGLHDNEKRAALLDARPESVTGEDTLNVVHSAILNDNIPPGRVRRAS